MNRQLKNPLSSVLCRLAIGSGFLILGLSNTTILHAEPKPETMDANITETEMGTGTAIAQSQTINQVKLLGNTVLSATDLAPILDPLQGQELSPEQVTAIAEAITQLYVSQGYVTSLAEFSPQNIVAGVAQIQAIKGQLERVDITGTVHTNPEYVRSRVALGISTPFNANSVEDQLRLLRTDPLFRNVTASLKPSTEAGKTLLVVAVEEAKRLGGSVSVDNYSPVSVGSERMGAELTYRNLTGFGDLLIASYERSTTGGSNLADFSYNLPINPMNGSVAIRYAPSDYRITDPAFEAFNIRGDSSLYDIVYRQPLIRTSRQEFALSFGFAHEAGQTFLFENLGTPFGIGPDEDGVSTTSVFRFGQDYTRRDGRGAWSGRSQFNIGTGLFDATFFTTPDASFFSWLGQAQRVQRLSSDALLIASFNSQLSADPLLASQQFTIGGGQSLRGFRQNARSGDNGFRFSLETRLITARDPETNRPTLQIAPFIDLGTIWNNDNNPTPLFSQNFLAAGGIGVILEPIEGLVLRIDAALPFVDLKERGNNLQDAAIHFSTNYQF